MHYRPLCIPPLFAGVLLAGALLAPAAAAATEPEPAGWKLLFDGKTLGKWQIAGKYDFRNHGKVEVKDGALVLRAGNPGTAVRFSGEMPKSNYEIALEAQRVDGDDFFCGMTFPVGDRALSLILGGWGGRVTGLSCIDGEPAVENETCDYRDFQSGRWYAVRVRVTDEKVEAWVDKEQIVDFEIGDKRLTIWFEPDSVLPLGIATWRTSGALRNIRLQQIDAAADDAGSPGQQ